MVMEHEKYEKPEEPLSVREARKARAAWEDELKRKMLLMGLDPVARFADMAAAGDVIALLKREVAIATNKEVSMALGYPYNVQHGTKYKHREYMKSGYTMKINTTGHAHGGKDRVFSMPGLALVAMSAKTERGRAVRAWMAEVVAIAARHPDFRHLFPD